MIPAAGAAAKNADETRLELLNRNVKITHECIGQLMAEKFNGVLLITTDAVDVLALVAQKELGLPASQVIGSGTVINTARLRALLGDELGSTRSPCFCSRGVRRLFGRRLELSQHCGHSTWPLSRCGATALP